MQPELGRASFSITMHPNFSQPHRVVNWNLNQVGVKKLNELPQTNSRHENNNDMSSFQKNNQRKNKLSIGII